MRALSVVTTCCFLSLAASAPGNPKGSRAVLGSGFHGNRQIPRRSSVKVLHAGISSIIPGLNRGHAYNTPSSLYNNMRAPYMVNAIAWNYQGLFNPTAINPVPSSFHPVAAKFQSTPRIKSVTSIDEDLPVIGFQSSQWVWPNDDVSGPLGGIPFKSDES